MISHIGMGDSRTQDNETLIEKVGFGLIESGVV